MSRFNSTLLNRTPLSRFVASQFAHSCLLSALLLPAAALAEDISFNPKLLETRGGQSMADISQFERGGQLPGTYRVDIYLNSNFIETRDVTFVSDDDRLLPELTAAYWRNLGIKSDASPALMELADDQLVSKPGDYIEHASTQFDFNKLRLNLSIPQASLEFRARDHISPELWDHGMPALMLNYGLNYNNSQSRNNGGDYSNLFARFDSGLNLGAWRLRNNSTFSRNEGNQPTVDANGKRIKQKQVESRWQSLNTYLERDVHQLNARLTMGETSTPGDIFDSVQFRGVQLASDDNMLPDSLRGFAPVVRGIARSNAQVTVEQNGAVIYQTSVAPGAFEIRDLYPTASSGNLDVTVREADGSETRFVQPFSAVPGMVRDNQLRFSFSGGQYRSWSTDVRTPNFLQGTAQYGVSNATTLYGGLLGADNYQAIVTGIGQGLGTLGSLSLDVTHAKSRFEDGPTRSGQSYRAQYAKDIMQSGTSFVLAGYRYSTEGYYDFTEANELLRNRSFNNDDQFDFWRRTHNKRSRMQAQVSQQLGDLGSISLTGYKQDYWGSDGSERTLMLGYHFNYAGASFSLNLSDTRTPYSDSDRSLYLGISVPLDRWLAGSSASYGLNRDNRGRTSNQLGLNGTALDNRLNWSVNESVANQGAGNSGALNGQYTGAYGSASAGYYYNDSSQQFSTGLSGGVVAHPYGVTLSQPLSDTSVLVRVPDAQGVSVRNQRGVATDWRGYAVVPYATPYRKNNISLNTESLPDNVDVEETAKTVVPTRGALVLADYKANVGARVLANVLFKGKPVPFGATASLMVNGQAVSNSFVGDNGDLYLSGVPAKSRVHIQWGKGNDEQCRGDISLNSANKDSRFRNVNISCR
ncbi:fimbria/pilus outer membrane usher protein [Pantoea sp.]|uniref:fimbria/pilus outer membrane usher protein n=1 Tax=Pantoea sp. TaxID=69393 RepID=UPI0031DB24EB